MTYSQKKPSTCVYFYLIHTFSTLLYNREPSHAAASECSCTVPYASKRHVMDCRGSLAQSQTDPSSSSSSSSSCIFNRSGGFAPRWKLAQPNFSEWKWVFESVGTFPHTTMATETFLVNEEPSRGPGMPECFVVSDSYRYYPTHLLNNALVLGLSLLVRGRGKSLILHLMPP
ncbi:hypothetical protein JOB18_031714 [Solea senegalensis]|uniref:Uncharacterized protein n=1 Tax=Solea senegalensis TaxID=28829 RepID=A0AAV6RIX7_SOLSE|nr:hypothetical protein JOB18_031714 [Solea senegalensis]